MNYWMMKTEPGEFSFDDLIKDKKTMWDGVRNYQARNNMKAMKKGDHVLIYHSVTEKAVAGIAKVIKEHYPDPVDNEKGAWVLVDIAPVKPLKKKVSLAEIKATESLQTMLLIKQSRLSVCPVTKREFDIVVKMGS